MILFLLLFCAHLGAQENPEKTQARAALYLKWNNGQRQRVRLKKIIEEGHPILTFLIATPGPEINKAWRKSEDEWIEIPLQEVGSVKYLQLNYSEAEVRIEDPNGQMTEHSYQLEPYAQPMVMDGNCKKAGLKLKFAEMKASKYPAMLACEMQGSSKNKEIEKITFATTKDANWYGTAAFEMGGKGEAWKSFAYKDVMALDKWAISWRSDEDKTTIQVQVPKLTKAKKTAYSPFAFSVGAEYFSGKVQKNTLSENISGLVVPLRFSYRKNKAWWSLGGGYDFFALAFQKGTGGSGSTSKFEIWGGAEYGSSFKVRGTLGYLNRTMTAPTAGVSGVFEAPRLGLDLIYESGKVFYGAALMYATTSAAGAYSESDVALFYQSPFYWKTQQRIQLHYTQMKSSTVLINVDGSWFGLSFNLQF